MTIAAKLMIKAALRLSLYYQRIRKSNYEAIAERKIQRIFR